MSSYRPHTPEQQLALLIAGLLKLQARIEAGERIEWAQETSERQPVAHSKGSDILQVEGGYVPGRYVLADKLVEEIAFADAERRFKEL